MSEERTTRYHLRRREFLNEDPELPAFIVGVVEDTRDLPDDDSEQRWNWGTVVLDLADCSRRVSFDLDLHDVVNAVRDAIAVEVESRNARPAKKEKAGSRAPDVVSLST